LEVIDAEVMIGDEGFYADGLSGSSRYMEFALSSERVHDFQHAESKGKPRTRMNNWPEGNTSRREKQPEENLSQPQHPPNCTYTYHCSPRMRAFPPPSAAITKILTQLPRVTEHDCTTLGIHTSDNADAAWIRYYTNDHNRLRIGYRPLFDYRRI